MLASIPSPSSGSIEIGPLTFRAYGVMIALGVLAAVWLAGKRFAQRGWSSDHATGLAMWAVPAGIIGARIYHVITDWRTFEGRWGEAFKIWEGGLGILGGVIAGSIAGIYYFRKHNVPLGVGFDIVAPSLPLAQAIGRWGNWFNQELYGRPTDLPWGLEIDVDERPAEYINDETFHPTFLYESIWNLVLVGILLKVDSTRRLRPWGLFFLYLAGYSVGRLWIEAIRIDPASEIAGLRVNLWVFGVLLIGSVIAVIRSVRSPSEMESLVPLEVEARGGVAAGRDLDDEPRIAEADAEDDSEGDDPAEPDDPDSDAADSDSADGADDDDLVVDSASESD
ncbi:MAG: prolipoprotein diacylglyceryl transferase [Acidimicrobiales bacterium]